MRNKPNTPPLKTTQAPPASPELSPSPGGAMPRKRLLEEVVYRPDPGRAHPPIDEKVEKRLDTEHARRVKADEISATDDALKAALARAQDNARTAADSLVVAEMRRIVEGRRRRGARKPRGLSEEVTQRVKATLWAVSELSPEVQKHHRGEAAVRQLLNAVRAMGHRTDDDTLAKDIAKVRPLIRLMQTGKVSPSRIRLLLEGRLPVGRENTKTRPPASTPVSEQTRLEQAAARQAVALAEARMVLLRLIQRRFGKLDP